MEAEESGGRRGSKASGPELIIGAALVAAMAGAAGFAAVYAVGGGTQALGAVLGVAFAGLAVGLGIWGKHLAEPGPVVEEREVLTSTPADRAAVAAELARGQAAVTSRRRLLALLGGAMATLGAAALFPLRSLGPSPLPELRRTAWAAGKRLVDSEGVPVRLETLPVNGVLTVFPEDSHSPADSQTILIRLPPGSFRIEPGREDWTPAGYVAFSKVCTHAGCPVGLYEAETHQLLCPCHQSVFDVLDGAKPVFGPATRSLPQLPIAADDDGFLVALGDFPEPVGPGFWSFET